MSRTNHPLKIRTSHTLKIRTKLKNLTYLNMTMVHKNPLQVEKPGRFEHFAPKDSHVVMRHPQDLDFRVQVDGHCGESGARAVGLAFSVGPFAIAVFGAMVEKVS